MPRDKALRDASNAAYRARNRRALAEKSRAYNQEHAEAVNARAAVYREGHREELAAAQRSRAARDPRKTLVHAAKYRAKKRGLPFDLRVEDLEWPTYCPVLGIELRYGGSEAFHPNSASLDRRIDALGYVKGNVVVISWRANKLKGDNADPDELQKVVDYVRRCKDAQIIGDIPC